MSGIRLCERAVAPLLLTLTLLAASPQAHGHEQLSGGLTLRSRAPLYDHSLSYPTGRMAVLRPHQTEVVASLSHVNVWAQMPGYFFDGEWSRLELRLAHSFFARTELALHVSLLGQSGGFLDRPIEGFHTLLHITQSRRDQHPRDRLRVATLHSFGANEALGAQDAGVAVQGPITMMRHSLGTTGAASRSFVEAHVQWPLPTFAGGRSFVGAGPEMLLAISTYQPLSRRVEGFVASGIMVRPLTRAMYGMPIAAFGKFLLLGVNIALRRNLRIAAHYLGQDGMVEHPHYSPLNLSTHEFVIGAKWSPAKLWRYSFELGIIENSIHDANTPDFGVTLATSVATG